MRAPSHYNPAARPDLPRSKHPASKTATRRRPPPDQDSRISGDGTLGSSPEALEDGWTSTTTGVHLPPPTWATGNDKTAAQVVDGGGGLEAVVKATGLRTLENVLRLIDPAILEQARQNDE